MITMKSSHSPLPQELPALPVGCDEIQPTVKPDAETQIHDHIDRLPGLDREQMRCLSTIAARANDEGSTESTVLGLEDLLRRRADRSWALHPRVMQVVPLDALDPLLNEVSKLLDTDPYWNSYQYPEYLLECRGAAPDELALYRPEYHILVSDIARDLRAKNILTSIRPPGDDFTDSEMIESAVKSMQANETPVCGSFTFIQSDDNGWCPDIYFNDGNKKIEGPTNKALTDYCHMLFERHELFLEINDKRMWRRNS